MQSLRVRPWTAAKGDHTLRLNYENLKVNQNHRIYAHKLEGKLVVMNAIFDVNLVANCTVEYFQINNNKFLSNKKLNVNGVLKVDSKKGLVDIPLMTATLSSSTFITKGFVNYSSDLY